MKIGIAALVAGLLALPLHAQDADKTRIRQLEAQMAKYREASKSLVATLTKANQELNAKVKSLSRERADLSVRVAKLEVSLGVKPSRRVRGGLLYRGQYKASVDLLTRTVEALKRADTVSEALKLLEGASRGIAAAQRAFKAPGKR